MQRLLRKLLVRGNGSTVPPPDRHQPDDGTVNGSAVPIGAPARPAAAAIPDDTAIAAAAGEIEALGAHLAAAVETVKDRLSAAESESAALRQSLAAAETALAASGAQAAASKAAAAEWRNLLYTSERMLIGELGTLAERTIEAAAPDPHADAATPEISIVVPVYNRAHLIGTAVKSVLAQSFNRWELIVVDDASTDDIEGAMRPFLADPRIRFLRRKVNGGECVARNDALPLTRGEIIAYLDSDNYWYPDFLGAAAQVFRADPELDVAYGAIAYEWPNGDVRFYQLPFDRERLLQDNLVDMNVLVHRRRCYQRFGGFDEDLERAVDWDLLLRYTAHRPAAHIPAMGARYRAIDAGRLSQTRPLGPSVLRIRRKWWPRPESPPRILYVCQLFPQLSETSVYDEIACIRRFGAAVEVYAPRAGVSPFSHDLVVHRGELAAAICAMRPDVVHVHWLSILEEHRAALAAAGVPVTVRGHSFDATPAAIARALDFAPVKHVYLLPATAARELPADDRLRVVAPIFDTMLFKPAHRKDRRLVLRATAGLATNGLRFMVDLARRLPRHRTVLALSRATGHDHVIEAIRAYKAETASPVELLLDVPRAEMAAIFGEAGIYVHTLPAPDEPDQKRIGGPLSIAEAMATGAYVLVRRVPGLVDYVGDAGAAYQDVDEAAALIRATEAWSDAQWRAAHLRSVDRAFQFHADELVMRPVFEDWCVIAREHAVANSAAARAPALCPDS